MGRDRTWEGGERLLQHGTDECWFGRFLCQLSLVVQVRTVNESDEIMTEARHCNFDGEQISLMCSEGIENPSLSWQSKDIIDNVQDLQKQIEEAFATARWPCETKCALMKILSKVDLRTEEMNKYTYWDSGRPYTRNLICTDNKNYTLLLLCWNPQRESKIHNHPCDGCYVKCVRGDAELLASTASSNIY